MVKFLLPTVPIKWWMMGMQRPMLLNTSIQSTFQTFLHMSSNSKSVYLSFCYAILVHLLDYAMEHAFVSSASIRESLNVKYWAVNMLAIQLSYHGFLSHHLLLQICLLSFDGLNFPYD